MNWWTIIGGGFFNAFWLLLGVWLGPKWFGMCSHKWGKWEVGARGTLHRGGINAPPVGTYEEQRRECSKCGKSQMREVSA